MEDGPVKGSELVDLARSVDSATVAMTLLDEKEGP